MLFLLLLFASFNNLFNFFFFFFTYAEPNAHKPKIITHRFNEHGRPEIHGIIREDETEVTLQNPLLATDDDNLGGACKCLQGLHNLFKCL